MVWLINILFCGFCITNFTESDNTMAKLITDIERTQHHIQTSGETMRQLAKPLECLGINHFAYLNLTPKSERILLSTHPELSEFFIQEKLYNLALTENYEQCQPGYILVSSLKSNDIVKQINQVTRELFNLGNYLIIIKKDEKNCEWFYFGINPEKFTEEQSNLIYMQNMQKLEDFTLIFKQQAFALIEQAKTERFYYPNDVENHVPELIITNMDKHLFETDSLIKKLKKFHVQTENGYVTLSLRQLQCLAMAAQGCSAKITAAKLNLTAKTVENYLDALKKKLSCHSKSALIDIAEKNDIIRLFGNK